jgi:type IV pilus assembly protein PilW
MRKPLRSIRAPRAALGFTLVELMISLVLGMIVTAAALAMFLSNKQVYATNEHLGRAQESVRLAYELMSREMRESGGGACEGHQLMVNVLRNPTANWWSDISSTNRVVGYAGGTAMPQLATGTAEGERIANTDAIELKSGVSDSVTITQHVPATTTFTAQNVNHGFSSGDIVLVCDFVQSSVLQITNAANGNATLTYAEAGAFVPGNCSKGLGFAFPALCTSAGTPYVYPAMASIAHMRMSRWYIGANAGGGRSLFQQTLVNNAGTPQVQTLEIAPGVQDLQLRYLVRGGSDYVAAGTVADWSTVVAVRVVLSVLVQPNGDGGDAVTRRLEHTVTLRNRI